MAYDNTNSGALFGNEDRQSKDDPSSGGKLDIEGVEYYCDAWRLNADEMDLRVKRKGVRSAKATGDGDGDMKRVDKTGKSEKYPDWKGSLKVGDQHYWISGWKRTGNNSGKEFLSLKVEKKEPRSGESKRTEPANGEDNDQAPLPF
jgi:uncharacterized protein (DUF736 family)